MVAKDTKPAADTVGLGSTIFFPQGDYKGDAAYNRSDGTHWHLGVVDAVHQVRASSVLQAAVGSLEVL
jgi:hypothetical protein